jgi:hypothetical protein
MGFAIYYSSLQSISDEQEAAVRRDAQELIEGRTWLSCEPVCLAKDQADGRLWGSSKPNFQPHPDDAAAAAAEGLPDGTVNDMLEVLCQLSRNHGLDWEFSHDDHPEPIGFIRNGVCGAELFERIETLGEMVSFIGGLESEFSEFPGNDPFPTDDAFEKDRDPSDYGGEPPSLGIWPEPE